MAIVAQIPPVDVFEKVDNSNIGKSTSVISNNTPCLVSDKAIIKYQTQIILRNTLLIRISLILNWETFLR